MGSGTTAASMRARDRIIPLLSLTVFAWGLSSLGTTSSACATGHRTVYLTNFSPESNPLARPLYWTTESTDRTFTVARGSHDCSIDPVTADYAVNSATATSGQDFAATSGTTGGLYDAEGGGGPTSRDIPIDVTSDGAGEPGIEEAQIVLSNPAGGAVLGPIPQAPLVIVDEDGGARVSFDQGPYAQSESWEAPGQATVPVFRAGDVAAVTTTVSYSIDPGATNPATPGTDFTGATSGTLTFQPGDRVELISFTLVNDTAGEQPEELAISLSNPSSGTLDTPSTQRFTILDNEEPNPPNSRFHHPRQGLKYRTKDYRIREVHVFTADDPGGSGVVGVEWALRRNLKSGACQWWTGKKARFKAGGCQDEVWHTMDVYDPGAFYFDRLGSLRPSIGTNVKSYTGFSRAIDGAQNVEQAFDVKRNMNTFEVRKK